MARWTRRPNNEVDTEIAAYLVLEKLRWPDGPYCPHCLCPNPYFIPSLNGKTRKAGPSKVESPRRIWKCRLCRKQFSVLIGTPMSGSHVSPSKWLIALSILVSEPETPIRELGERVGLSPRTALKLRKLVQREFLEMPGPSPTRIIPNGNP